MLKLFQITRKNRERAEPKTKSEQNENNRERERCSTHETVERKYDKNEERDLS